MRVLADPMEQLIEAALRGANVEFRTDEGGGNPSGLDFLLPNEGVEIEVKRMHTPRIAEQMSRAENVIVAQGPKAVALLAAMIRRAL
jgi:hypothetical protein